MSAPPIPARRAHRHADARPPRHSNFSMMSKSMGVPGGKAQKSRRAHQAAHLRHCRKKGPAPDRRDHVRLRALWDEARRRNATWSSSGQEKLRAGQQSLLDHAGCPVFCWRCPQMRPGRSISPRPSAAALPARWRVARGRLRARAEHLVWQAEQQSGCRADRLRALSPTASPKCLAHIEAHRREEHPAVRRRMAALRDGGPCRPARCLARAFVLFPDPWPKTRHHKRRFVPARDPRHTGRPHDPGRGAQARDRRSELPALDGRACLRPSGPSNGWAERPGGLARPGPADWPPTRYEAKDAGRPPAGVPAAGPPLARDEHHQVGPCPKPIASGAAPQRLDRQVRTV